MCECLTLMCFIYYFLNFDSLLWETYFKKYVYILFAKVKKKKEKKSSLKESVKGIHVEVGIKKPKTNFQTFSIK